MRRTGQSLNYGKSIMESHGRLFSSRWIVHCSSSMAFRIMQRRCEDQLKEDYESKVTLNVWDLRDEKSAVRLSHCENVQEYSSKILSYGNDFTLCANPDSSSTGSGTILKSKLTYYLMKGVPKDDDCRFFTQLMYGKINTLHDDLEEVVMKINADAARLQKEDDL